MEHKLYLNVKVQNYSNVIILTLQKSIKFELV